MNIKEISKANIMDNVSHLIIPEKIKQKFKKISGYGNLRTNENILLLWKDIRQIVDPENIISDLIQKEVATHGHAIVSGFPVDNDKPETPVGPMEYKPKGEYLTEKTLIYLSSLFGKPHAYIQENNGEYIHDLYPIKGNETVAAGTGSEVDLEFHTEIAFDINKPDYLILTAVRSRSDQNVPTTLVNVNPILNRLTNDELNILQEKNFFIRAPYSFSDGDDIYYLRTLANFNNGNDFSFNFNFNSGVTYCVSQKAEQLFEKLRREFNDNVQKALLQPGSALIIDNNKMLHGRSLFKPKFDGKDRWLQRIYVKKEGVK